MAEVTGHAAFHVKLKDAPRGSRTRKDRRGLLREAMRHLDPKDVQRHAANNANIVPAEAYLNAAFVNDGAGGFAVASSVKEVLDYGDERLRRVRRKITDKQVTVTTFVVHLPKTLCVEVPDFYPRFNPDGSERLDPETGEPMSRARWVARDHDEAMRYFRDAVAQLGDDVIPGGIDAIHGWATNFDESTPHIQIMADPFALDPKAPPEDPDGLRTEYNQAYGSHREVRDAKGRQLGSKPKLSGHQERFRKHMVGLGWPVEEKVGKRHGKELPPELFKQSQDDLAEARAQEQWTRELARDLEDQQRDLNGQWADLSRAQRALAERESVLDERERGLDEARDVLERDTKALEEQRRDFEDIEMPRLRRKAVTDGTREGREKGIEEAEAKLRAWRAEKEEGLAEQIRELIEQHIPLLVDEYLDLKDHKGNSRRPGFNRLVDEKIAEFEREHDVVDKMQLEPGDREQFILDGGVALSAEVADLKAQRERDRTVGGLRDEERTILLVYEAAAPNELTPAQCAADGEVSPTTLRLRQPPRSARRSLERPGARPGAVPGRLRR